jgi:hypothetical protein
MEKIAESHYKNLDKIKSNVEDSREYNRKNNERYHRYRSFIFKTTLSKEDRDVLAAADKPAVEVNVLETYLSRLWGEWSKQVPDLSVRAQNDEVDPNQVDVVEGILRSIFSGSDYENKANDVYRDTMSGGFSAFRVCTEYENDTSMRQVIRVEKVYDPTLTGFDPLARESSKSDGQFCFELVPKYEEEVKEEYPDLDLSSIKTDGFYDDGTFRWSYMENNKKVYYISDYYEKQYSYVTMVEVSDPTNPDLTHTMLKKEYDRIIEAWDSITEPPQILQKARRKQTKIMRYKFVGDVLVERPEELDYDYLPLIFVDGNSAVIEGKQITRPYAYNALDAQRIKNLSASNMVNELENSRQTDVMMAKSSLPLEPEYMEGWLNPQKTKASLIYEDIGPEGQQNPPPTIFPRSQVNPAFMQVFDMQDKTIQTILGSYDAALGINQNQLSGVAIVEGATQSNNAAMPYVINYLASLNQVAKVVMNLVPKYYKTLRTVPVVTADGKHSYHTVNNSMDPQSAILDFDKNDLEVHVKAGANFDVQRNKALTVMIELMKANQTFSAIMNTKGLPLLLDNIDIRGKDQLKSITEEFLKEQEQKQAQAAQQPNPQEQIMKAQMQLEQQKLQLQAQKQHSQEMIEAEKLQQAQYKLMAEIEKDKALALMRMTEAQNEADRTAAEIEMDRYDQQLKTLQVAMKAEAGIL